MRTELTVTLVVALAMLTMGMAPAAGASASEEEQEARDRLEVGEDEELITPDDPRMEVIQDGDGSVKLVLSVPVEQTDDLKDFAEAESSARCGGFSPVITSCSSGGILENSPVRIIIDPGIEFQGYIQNKGGTSTGTWDWECTFFTVLLPLCSQPDFQGTLYLGQAYTLRGNSDLLSTGSWEVAVQT